MHIHLKLSSTTTTYGYLRLIIMVRSLDRRGYCLKKGQYRIAQDVFTQRVELTLNSLTTIISGAC